MKGQKAIVGVFTYIDDTIHAIRAARKAQLEFEVYAPFYNHELDEEASAGTGRSHVRKVTLTGALLGLTFGFALAILCSLDWPLRVSAKDVVSVPAFVVIGYECTILFGGIFTLLALLHFCRIPDLFRKTGFDPRFTQDKFGVVIGCDAPQIDQARELLSDCGAEEIDVREGL